MKIKELHIRNIASIEKADIDFERELVDAVTGSPSSIFLISGDTGTGKTVLLDAISMALYKKTPRIADVANRNINNFRDNDGRDISVSSIEQYTRLGISENDECYSEVIFEGNDGRNYHARLDLGILKSRTKDAKGNYLLKHRSPQWNYRVGTDDWQKVDPNGQVLVDAVGLSFEQFGRMAMLAQGQFATFLTGDKTERESILEQLTNTAKFTVYGNAISNLFKRAKSAKNTAQAAYDTERGHTLPPEQVQSLAQEYAELKLRKSELDKNYKKECERLKIVEDIEDFVVARTKAESEKTELEGIIAGEEYRQKKQLVSDWDTTNKERQLLSEKQGAEKRKTEAGRQIEIDKEVFHMLSSDFVYRETLLNQEKVRMEQLMSWIGERKIYDELFANANATDLQFRQFGECVMKISDTEQKLKEEKDKTKQLLDRTAECAVAVEKAKAEVLAKQEAIDLLLAKRNELDAAGIGKEKDEAVKRLNDLGKVLERIGKSEDARRDALQVEKEIEADEEKLDELQYLYNYSQHVYTQKAEEEEKASSLLNTMQMSLDDKLIELRKRLQAGHSDTCPLCGQHIDNLLVAEDFMDMLTPLQLTGKEAKRQLEEATRQRDAAKTVYDKAKGALDTKKKEHAKIADINRKEDLAIKTLAESLLLDVSYDLRIQIVVASASENDHIKQLDAKILKAENLQKSINALTEEKKPLDIALQQSDRQLSLSQNDIAINSNRISEFEKILASYLSERDRLVIELTSLLATYCPEWQKDVPAARQRLGKDAKEYTERKKQAEKMALGIVREENMLASMRSICENILAKQAGWVVAEEPVEYGTKNILEEWTKFYARVEHQREIYDEAVRSLKASSEALDVYYAQSGKTENELISLTLKEKKVAEARSYVQGKDSELKYRCDAIREATSKISTLLKELQTEKLEDVPSKEVLQELVNELAGNQQGLAGKIGSIEEKLNTIRQNEEKLARAKQDLDKATCVFDKWNRINDIFGGTRFRTLVQTYILRPLLNNANIHLERITDRYRLTCSEENQQLSILVLDRYNKNQVRSVTVLSGGERFMISLALSLALSSLNRQDMNVNILFIDEGFGTLDETNLNSVMATLERLQEIAGQTNRRVGIISHREELVDRIPVKINVRKKGEGRSVVEITHE